MGRSFLQFDLYRRLLSDGAASRSERVCPRPIFEHFTHSRSGSYRFSAEERPAGCVADRNHCRVFEFSLDGNGIEGIAHLLSAANKLQVFLPELFLKHGSNREHTSSRLTKSPEQGIILKFSRDDRRNSAGGKLQVKATSDRSVFRG
jgi:hypothetical protein